MDELNVGLSTSSLLKTSNYSELKPEAKNNMVFSYLVVNYKGLSVDTKVNLYHSSTLLRHLQNFEENLHSIKILLRLDNPYIFSNQLKYDDTLLELLALIEKTEGYVVYTNNVVKDFIISNYSNIHLILSEYRYALGSFEDYIELNSQNNVEINSILYERLIPLLEYNYINPDNIWLSFTNCRSEICNIRSTCIHSKGFCQNHKIPCIDIVNTEWKYHIGYKTCYKDISPYWDIEVIKGAIIGASSRGINKFLLCNKNYEDAPRDIVYLFVNEEYLSKLKEDLS